MDLLLYAGTLQAYFDVCDHDHDGEITFSEFLHFVELCDLNPEHHMAVSDADVRAAFTTLAHENQTISFDDACEYQVADKGLIVWLNALCTYLIAVLLAAVSLCVCSS